MIGVQSSADRQPFIARRGLNPGLPKRCFGEEFSVGDAVQRAAASHGQVWQRHPLVQLLQQVKEDFLEAVLHGKGEVHVALRNFGMRLARLAEQLLHAIGEMPRQSYRSIGLDLHALIASQGHEIIEVQCESRQIVRVDDLADTARSKCPSHKAPAP